MWQTAVVLPVVSCGLYYLASQALITRVLWSRYPKWLDAWASCPACSGTWYGAAIVVALGWLQGWTFFGVDAISVPGVILGAFWGMYWTPVLAYAHIYALSALHSSEEGGESVTDSQGGGGHD